MSRQYIYLIKSATTRALVWLGRVSTLVLDADNPAKIGLDSIGS